MKQKIIGLVVLVLVLIGLLFIVRPPAAKTPPTTEGQVVLADLGVTVALPQGLDGIALGKSSIEGVGPAVVVALPPTAPGEKACELGVYYTVPKSAIGAPDSKWNESDLKAATVVNGQVPPQAKEFSEFYFVFEQARTACSRDAAAQQVEATLRMALWIAVSTATLIPV